jgi:hypothetical protein
MLFYGLQNHYMVIKKSHLTGNRIPTARNAGRHASNWTTAETGPLLLRDMWSNSEESGKYNCILQRNSGVSTPNILARMLEEVPLPYCKARAESGGLNRPGSFVKPSEIFSWEPFFKTLVIYVCPIKKRDLVPVYRHKTLNINVIRHSETGQWRQMRLSIVFFRDKYKTSKYWY